MLKLFGLIPGVGPILSWIASAVFPLAQSFFSAWLNADVAKTQALAGTATSLGVAAVQADAATSQTWLGMVKTFKTTQWLIAAALIPPLVHQGMVYLDSSPFPYVWLADWWPGIHMHVINTWHVPPAPPPYGDREWWMIGSLLGIQGSFTGVMGVLNWLHK
jgi:hypothetical protein